jgi:hypothetical protein
LACSDRSEKGFIRSPFGHYIVFCVLLEFK